MSDTGIAAATPTPVEEIQQEWHEMALRVGQLERECGALETENKTLRFLLERVIEHRQKSHGELVLLLSGLVSKLPINDVGVIVSRLVEHNSHVSQVLAAFLKGKADAPLPQPSVLKELDQTKRELHAALKPLVEELIRLETPFEPEMLKGLISQPESFFSPAMIRANRCFITGQVPRERIVREFGEEAVGLFQDMTTDAKLNPRPKPDEILLAFRSDFETAVQQSNAMTPERRKQLTDLYARVLRSKASTPEAHHQRTVLQKLSFILELLHFYENQGTEPPDVTFAQRLPTLVEQFVTSGPRENLDEKLIVEVEQLLVFVVNPDHRQVIINNIGKGGGMGRILKHVLRLRADKTPSPDEEVNEFIRDLIPAPQSPPSPQTVAAILRLLRPETQRLVVKAIIFCERLRKETAETLGKAAGKELDLKGLEDEIKAEVSISPEAERQMAWEKIKQLIMSRTDPAVIAASIRGRLHVKYDADEMKQSWVTLTEADPISLIRVFCQLPYLADGSTDPVSRAVMETYVTRLMHEKYAGIYQKVLSSLRNMFRANPHSPTLLNFLALVKWVDPSASSRMAAEIGMPAAA